MNGRGKRCVRDPIEAEIAHRVRERRISLGMTQSELALKVGISYQQLFKWENNVNRIACGALKKISDALSVTPQYFFGETPERNSDRIGERAKLNLMRNLDKLPQATRNAIMKMVNDLAKKEQ